LERHGSIGEAGSNEAEPGGYSIQRAEVTRKSIPARKPSRSLRHPSDPKGTASGLGAHGSVRASVRAGRTPFFSGFSASSATARGGRSRLWSETRRCCCRGLLQAPGSTRLHRQTNPPWTVPIERNFARAGSCQGKYSEKEKSLSKRGNPRERKKIIGDLERNGSISDQGKKFKRRLQ